MSLWGDLLIGIEGVQFINKGSELMLRAILRKVKEAIPNAAFAMTPSPPWRPFEKIVAAGVYPKLTLQKLGIRWDSLAAIIPQHLRRRYGLVLDRELDAVLDASGFAYGDQWGPRPTEVTAKKVKRWKRQGTLVILLPQAFGPFSSARIRKAFRNLVLHADLIFARDPESYNHIVSVVGEVPHVRIAPDFTVLVEGVLPVYWSADRQPVCVVPNYRMVDKTSSAEGEKYLYFLVRCVRLLRELGEEVIFLIHEGEQDYQLAMTVCEKVGLNIPILVEDDPVFAKGILGASKVVIGSRYHALIGALSQGVPCLGTGWSHKYVALFEDYGVPEALVSVDVSDKELREKLVAIVSDQSRKEIVVRLRQKAAEHKEKAERMWEEVLGLLCARRSACR